MFQPRGAHCFPALIYNCHCCLWQPRPAPAVFYTAKGRQVTGTAAGARDDQTQETTLLFMQDKCQFPYINVDFSIAQGRALPPKCQKKFVLLSANKRTKRKLLLFLQGETSQELTPMAAQEPWYSLAPGGGGSGVEFRVPGRTTVFLAQSSSAWVLPFSAFTACLRAGCTDGVFL